jgi:tape measure domain-containing protein
MAATVGQVVVDMLLNTAKFEANIKKVSRSFSQMGRDFSNAGRAMTMGITLPIVGAGAAAIKLAGEFEQTTIAFNTMLGSTAKSTKFLKDLKDFATKTPFEFKDLTQASKRMIALGFSAEQVIPILTNIGDAVAGMGGGAEMIDRVTLALGQMQAKGKVSAQEMNQLAESGIPAWELLSKRIGKSIPEAMKLAEKGAISASIAIPAILEGMNQRFGGLMVKQNQTLLGQFSNLKDQLYFIITDLGTSLMPVATKFMDGFLKPLAAQIKGMVDWFSSLSKENQALIVKTVALTAAIGPLVWAFGSLATGISSMLTLSSRLLTLISGGGGLIGAVTSLGAAALFAGAIFAGWKIAEWIDNLDLFGRHARVAENEIIKQAEAFRNEATDIGAVREAMAKYQALLDKGTISQNTFNGILGDLTKQRGTETLQQYRDRMEALVNQYKAAHPELFKAQAAMNGAAAGASNLNLAIGRSAEEIARLKKEFSESYAPLDSLVLKFKEWQEVGIPLNGIIKANYANIVEFARKQRENNAPLSEYEKHLEDIAKLHLQMSTGGGGLSDYTLRVVESTQAFINVNSVLAENMRQMGLVIDQTIKASQPSIGERIYDLNNPDIENQMKAFNESFAAMTSDSTEAFVSAQTNAMETYRSLVSETVEYQLSQFQIYYEQLELLRQNDIISEEEYSRRRKQIAAEEQVVKLSRYQTFFGTLATMETSHIRAIAAVGKAAAIAQATINTYEGATKALAQGGIWGAIQMGAVLAAGFAQVAAIASQGFKAGGYTGEISQDAVAGVVHGREFVVNAEATRANLPLLKMLNEGRAIGSQMDNGPSFNGWPKQQMNVTIANYGTSKQFEVEHLDEGTIRIIARDEAYGVLSKRGPEVIANDLTYANSKTSKAVARHTTARRGDR